MNTVLFESINSVSNYLFPFMMGHVMFNDQQIFIISRGETSSCSCLAPFVVEARIKPNTFRPVSPTLYQLSYPPRR
jgi:hypothetical protein